jgi:hypothetical protein
VQEFTKRLKAIATEFGRVHLPPGEPGTMVLDIFESLDKIRANLRDQAKEMLKRTPDALPGWHLTETAQRVLSKDTLKVFEVLADRDDSFSYEEFVAACTVSLTSLRKLFTERNPDWSPDQVEHTLNRALVDLISFDTVTRLSRSKDRQLNLSL